MTRLTLAFLGAPQIKLDDKDVSIGRTRALALLAYLAVTQQPATRDTLTHLFWPDYDSKQSSAYLRQTLWTINKAIGKEWLSATTSTVELDFASDVCVDVIEYRRLLRIVEYDANKDRLPGMIDAAKLYKGDFLQGFTLEDSTDFQQWQLFESESLRQSQMVLLGKIVDLLADRGDFARAIEFAQRWLTMDLLNEPAHRQLMKLYSWAGQRGQAVRQFQECTQILSKELGVPPADATVKLFETITQNRLAPPAALVQTQTVVPQSAPPQISQSESLQSLIPPARDEKKPALVITPPTAKATEPPLARSTPETKTNLPPSITPFIGRETELEQIASLLAEDSCRMVTLVGPGGIGKTRLAVTVAQTQHEYFIDGVYFVPLADLSETDRLTTAIANVLGFTLYRREDEPLQQLLAYLAEKKMLLVLDNFEHLLEAAPLVTTLLLAAPRVKVIATSRERLNIEGEWLVEVPGLTYPRQIGAEMAIEQMAVEYSAIELFIRSSQRVNASFHLDQNNRVAVVRICQLVEGMPLALELAASWMRLLLCEEIVAEIQKGISILSTNQRSLPDRHRSMIALFNYSWFLLSEVEREVVQKLSVFRGGFRRESAQSVAGAALPILLSLADKSLIRNDGEGRYSMHELLRQFADEKLAADPDAINAVHKRHADYFVGLLQRESAQLHGKNQKRILGEIVADIDNIREAWRWIVHQQQIAAINSVFGTLATVYELLGWLHEGEAMLGVAIAHLQSVGVFGSNDPYQIEGKLNARQAFFSQKLGKYLHAKQQSQRSYEMLAAAGNSADNATVIIHCLNNLGEVLRIEGSYDEAERLLSESVELCRKHDSRLLLDRALNVLAIVRGTQGEYDVARKYLNESLQVAESIEDQLGIAKALNNLGILAYFAQDYNTAITFYKRSLAINQEMGHQYDAALALSNIGMAAQKQGDYKNAVMLLRESSKMLKNIGYELGVGLTLVSLSSALLDIGKAEEATANYLEVIHLGNKIRSKPLTLAGIAGVASLYEAMGNLEEAITLATLAHSHPATDDETRSKASDVLQLVRSRDPKISPAILADKTIDETLDYVVATLLATGVTPTILSAFSRSLSSNFANKLDTVKVKRK